MMPVVKSFVPKFMQAVSVKLPQAQLRNFGALVKSTLQYTNPQNAVDLLLTKQFSELSTKAKPKQEEGSKQEQEKTKKPFASLVKCSLLGLALLASEDDNYCKAVFADDNFDSLRAERKEGEYYDPLYCVELSWHWLHTPQLRKLLEKLNAMQACYPSLFTIRHQWLKDFVMDELAIREGKKKPVFDTFKTEEKPIPIYTFDPRGAEDDAYWNDPTVRGMPQ